MGANTVDSDKLGELVVRALAAIAGIAIVVAVVAALILTAAIAMATVGAAYGAGTALLNYWRALANNVRPAVVIP